MQRLAVRIQTEARSALGAPPASKAFLARSSKSGLQKPTEKSKKSATGMATGATPRNCTGKVDLKKPIQIGTDDLYKSSLPGPGIAAFVEVFGQILHDFSDVLLSGFHKVHLVRRMSSKRHWQPAPHHLCCSILLAKFPQAHLQQAIFRC